MTFGSVVNFAILMVLVYMVITFLFEITGLIMIKTNENQLFRGLLSLVLTTIIFWSTSG